MITLVDRPVIGRFAPSPTGVMHAGNIFSALVCWLIVRLQEGRIVLRIEDLDEGRSRKSYIERIPKDLEALGLIWDEGPYLQSTLHARYREIMGDLEARGLTYPCFCTRADLHAASAPHSGDQHIYAGTCRDLSAEEQTLRMAQRRAAFLNPEEAAAFQPALRVRTDDRPISFDDLLQGPQVCRLNAECGDFIVARSDGGASYQLAVVADDAAQGITCVVRGCDLLPITPQQIYLQQLLGYETPVYVHLPLLVDDEGVRLAKRHKSTHYDELLKRCGSPAGIIGHIAAVTGLVDEEEPLMPVDLLERLNLEELTGRLAGRTVIPFPLA